MEFILEFILGLLIGGCIGALIVLMTIARRTLEQAKAALAGWQTTLNSLKEAAEVIEKQEAIIKRYTEASSTKRI